MLKHYFSVLWFMWALWLMQGCSFKKGPDFTTQILKSEVTITLADKEPVTLFFETIAFRGRDIKPFRELLEKLARGEKVDINKPLIDVPNIDNIGSTPLEIAIDYGLGKCYTRGAIVDENFNAARYLLEQGANPNTAIHTLCSQPWSHGALGQRGLALLLSYGAQLDI